MYYNLYNLSYVFYEKKILELLPLVYYLTDCIFHFFIQITVTFISRCHEIGTVATRLPSRALHTCGQVPELLTVFQKDVYAMK